MTIAPLHWRYRRRATWYNSSKAFWELQHGVVEEVVASIPGAVFAVDEALRVVAWNRKAEEGLGLEAAAVLGRPCYEVVPAIDVETGRPCHEFCPLVRQDLGYGWAYNRVLRAPWAGGRRTRLDCFLFRCILSPSQQGTICFVGPPTASSVETHSRVLEALEVIYPLVAGPASPREALVSSLNAVLRTTFADAGELFLRDPESGELVLMEHQGLPTPMVRDFCRTAMGEGFPDLIASSTVPLLAMGRSPLGTWTGPTGWYLCVPLVAEGHVLGALGLVSQRRDFDVTAAARILFPVAVQLSVYLRWAFLAGEGRKQPDRERLLREVCRLRFHCLGPFQLFLDDAPIPTARFQRLKALAALKFLVAHRGRPVTREALMEFLWPEANPLRASGNLRVVLHALRRGLEPRGGKGSPSSFVLSEGDLIYLDPSERVWVDTEEFVRGARHAAQLASQAQEEEALTTLRRTASLYRGEYLEDEPYSDWCLFERERLKEVYLNVLKLMASLLSKRRDLPGAIDAYRTALSIDQGREESHRELIRLLWQARRQDEALRQYEHCRRILREDLGTEPTEETQVLYRSILAATTKRA